MNVEQAADNLLYDIRKAANDLHWAFMHDVPSREILRDPRNLKFVRHARNQLDELIRKTEITPVIEGVCCEPRQADMQKVEV